MKYLIFNGLLMAGSVLYGFREIHRLPDFPARPPREVQLDYAAVLAFSIDAPFRRVGAWRVSGDDPRLQGLSGSSVDGNRLMAISDLGTAVRLDLPLDPNPVGRLIDVPDGPGRFGWKKNRDAEALAFDGKGGWLVGYENRHSIWRYDADFGRGELVADIPRPNWHPNWGIEGLSTGAGRPIGFAQTGTEALVYQGGRWRSVPLDIGWQIADSSVAPDGGIWLLLRRINLLGFDAAIAPLVRSPAGFRLGRTIRIGKPPLDNFEGMAIAEHGDGLRFWLVSDDGHYPWPRTVLVAFDLPMTHENARR